MSSYSNHTQPVAVKGTWPEPCVEQEVCLYVMLHVESLGMLIATVCVVCWLDVEVVLGGGLVRVGG